MWAKPLTLQRETEVQGEACEAQRESGVTADPLCRFESACIY